MPTVKHKRPEKELPWEGPEAVGPRGGVTQSMLSRWLCCRERFRLMVVEGLGTEDTFNHRLEYGQMWHTCEEQLAKQNIYSDSKQHQLEVTSKLYNYCQNLCKRYPLQQEQVQHWYNVCKTQFPIYVKYWSKHQDVKDRTPLLQEQVFDVPYELPFTKSVVRLRGKWDSVDLIGKGKNAAIYLQENKTKGDIVEEQLKRQLGFDLQTMMYLVALKESRGGFFHSEDIEKILDEHTIAGVRYNVVRRPLSGGKGSIRKHQPTKSNPAGETDVEFYARLGQVIMEDEAYFFSRWRVEITEQDVRRFQHEFFDNALEELCNWWRWVSSPKGRRDPFADPIHYRLPYGVYNPLLEGGSSDMDEYLATKSEVGLTRNKKLFTELA
jgi:hypothetical protein